MTQLETLDGLVKICVDSAERYRRINLAHLLRLIPSSIDTEQ
jgi:hypothetical protein